MPPCRVPLPVLAEADEIFQGRQPCLTVVDGRSFLVLNLAPAAARDGTTWGVTFLDLQARGVQFQDLASDGGTGIRAGAAAAQLAVPLRPDLFHLLDDAWRVGQRLERQAYQAMQVAERARRADQEAQAAQRRRGPRLKVSVPLAEAAAQEAQAITTYDLFVWLLGEVRQALEPLSVTGRLTAVVAARSTLETALELLTTLPHAAIQTAGAATPRRTWRRCWRRWPGWSRPWRRIAKTWTPPPKRRSCGRGNIGRPWP